MQVIVTFCSSRPIIIKIGIRTTFCNNTENDMVTRNCETKHLTVGRTAYCNLDLKSASSGIGATLDRLNFQLSGPMDKLTAGWVTLNRGWTNVLSLDAWDWPSNCVCIHYDESTDNYEG